MYVANLLSLLPLMAAPHISLFYTMTIKYVWNCFPRRAEKVKYFLIALNALGDSKLENLLLHLCLALPKVSYVLLACPLSHIRYSTKEYEKATSNPRKHPGWTSVELVMVQG